MERRRGPSSRLIALTALIAAVGAVCAGAASTAAAPRPAPAMSGGSYPGAITAGADGNLWFTESLGRIGRITPSGVASEFPPTAAILGIRLNGTRSIGVRVRCPSGAPRACRGTLSLRLGPPAPADLRPQVRRLRLAPGRSVEVAFALQAAGRRQLKVHRRLAVSALVVPTAHSTAGSIQRGAILRASDPPAVAG